MTIADLLAASGIDRIDAEVLFCGVSGKDRAWVFAHAHDEANPAVASAFAEHARRRAGGEPIAYILGEKEFYGRAFRVGPGVLVPRPCTEELVRNALSFMRGERARSIRVIDEGIVSWTMPTADHADIRTIVDIGTGSGCIAVTLACELPSVTVIATDVSDEALAYARSNAGDHGVSDRVTCMRGSGLEPVTDLREPFLVVSNPPYVADETLLGDDVRAYEPRIALMGGGKSGADIVHEIVRQATKNPWCAGCVIECLRTQASIV